MTDRKPRVLVVEDEAAIRTGLTDLLVYHGFEPDTAEDGNAGLKKALSGRYDLVLLDVMLPNINGFEILERIRAKDREQPVIMLTAKSTDDDVIQGLKLGADDYVAKPFSVAQLTLRIEAVLRRSGWDAEVQGSVSLKIKDHEVSLDTRNLCARLSWRDEEPVVFTRREMQVLQYLATKPDQPVPREELLTRVWGYAKDTDIETRTVDIHIAKVRRKIEPDPSSPIFLVTVRGAGYRLNVDVG